MPLLLVWKKSHCSNSKRERHSFKNLSKLQFCSVYSEIYKLVSEEPNVHFLLKTLNKNSSKFEKKNYFFIKQIYTYIFYGYIVLLSLILTDCHYRPTQINRIEASICRKRKTAHKWNSNDFRDNNIYQLLGLQRKCN